MATSYPHIVMTVTPGRSGTRLLCQLLKPCPDSFVGHEPSPGFHAVLKNLRDRPALAKTFCEETKLPFIARQKTSHYIETGHIFCKGFLEAFVELGVPFDLIVLRRSFRDVAKSLERLGCIPGKTSSGLHYLLHPDQPDVLKIPSWQSLTNYQLAYWYTLEIARRQLLYAKLIREKGNRCAEITLDQLSDFEASLQCATQALSQ